MFASAVCKYECVYKRVLLVNSMPEIGTMYISLYIPYISQGSIFTFFVSHGMHRN